MLGTIFNQGILADHQITDLCLTTHRVEIRRGKSLLHSENVIAVNDEDANKRANSIFQRYMDTMTSPFMKDANTEPYSCNILVFTDKEGDYDGTNLVYRPPMIVPFVDGQVREVTAAEYVRQIGESQPTATPVSSRIISYGLSSFGYDFRVADDFKVFTNINSTMVDPLDFDDNSFVHVQGNGYCIVPPNSFVLARTVEKFNMPEDVVGVCTGKSTIARSGLSIMVTPLEPGWSGYLTLEYANTTPLPVKLYAGMGGGQIMFYRGQRPNVTYRDRNGKYQNQAAEVVTPRV